MPKDYICHVQLLDAHGQGLGWTKLPCETRGDGGIHARQHFVFEADADGIGVELAIHEPDLHVWTFVRLPEPMKVDAGKVFTVRLDKPLLHFQSSTRPLPPLTVRTNVTVGLGTAIR